MGHFLNPHRIECFRLLSECLEFVPHISRKRVRRFEILAERTQTLLLVWRQLCGVDRTQAALFGCIHRLLEDTLAVLYRTDALIGAEDLFGCKQELSGG
ncbi:MAG: hypothetical protein WAU00_15880 [Caldilinea sp.]|nr:hypothetical protein [Anaerolineales bacterium]